MRFLLLAACFAAALAAQVATPVVTVQSDPGGACRRSDPMRFNARTGQYWICQGNASLNWTNGIWVVTTPANIIVTVATDPAGTACDPKALSLRVPAGTLYTCQNGTYQQGLPPCAANTVLAGPSSGPSAVAGCRPLVVGDLPNPGGAGTPGGSTSDVQTNLGAGLFGGTGGSLQWSASFPGLSLAITNPTQGNDPNDRRALRWNCTTDSTSSNPGFTTEDCAETLFNIQNGQALYGSATRFKKTFSDTNETMNAFGSGQKIAHVDYVNCYSVSDCAKESVAVTYAGIPIAGDEAQGFSVVNYLRQFGSLFKPNINSAVTVSACNTTVTQDVTASRTAQTVTVASTTGCNVNDWLVFGQEAATGSPQESPMKITATGAGTITGIIVANYASGTTITPATVFNVDTTQFIGQDRVLVNLSASAYTTGTVASISGGGFTGSGTTWAGNMVGGNNLNPGCVSLTNDDYTGAPFDGSGNQGTLKSWYQISTSPTATGFGILSFSTSNDQSYRGNGVGNGAYTIRPCAKILRIVGNQLILETTSFTWTNGDSLELALGPYPDVSGYQHYVAAYTPGGTYRQTQLWRNSGARMFNYAMYFDDIMPTGGGADTYPWGTGLFVNRVKNVGVAIGETGSGYAFQATETATSASTKKPGYNFLGGNTYNGGIGTGLHGDYDTGNMFFQSQNVRLDIPAVAGTIAVVPSAALTGTRYVCVNTAGVLVSSTTACSGT